MRLAIAFLITLGLAPARAAAETFEIRAGDDLFGRLGMLHPGDEVIVHAGTYTTPGFFEVTWAGEAARPIVVRAAAGARPLIQGTPSQNVMNLGGSYFTLAGFEIAGGSHGIRLTTADHATLADLVLHELGDVGISCNFGTSHCDALTIRHCEIYDTGQAGTGEGLYLGCNDGSCVTANSIIENNYIHDLGGDQGDGIEIKTNSYGNIVRDNVIVRSRYPGITMYGITNAGAPNIVERNLVWHATVDNGIQVVGQVIVRNNLVIDAATNGIQSKASNGLVPHDVTIEHNTIVSAAVCLKTNDWAPQANQVIRNNALYCPTTTAIDLNGGAPNALITNNLGLGASTAAAGFALGASIAADLGTPTTGYPPVGSRLINAGMSGGTLEDFDGTPRDGLPDVGAYEHTTATNPGWVVVEGFKTAPPRHGDGSGGGGDGGLDPAADPAAGCCSSARPSDAALLVGLVAFVVRRRRRR